MHWNSIYAQHQFSLTLFFPKVVFDIHVSMRLNMGKRFVKRVLELIGAIAVVYLMLELLESQTMQQPDTARVGCS